MKVERNYAHEVLHMAPAIAAMVGDNISLSK